VLGAWACSLQAAIWCKPAPAALAALDFLLMLGLDSITTTKAAAVLDFSVDSSVVVSSLVHAWILL